MDAEIKDKDHIIEQLQNNVEDARKDIAMKDDLLKQVQQNLKLMREDKEKLSSHLETLGKENSEISS